jgi:hypothetical protein
MDRNFERSEKSHNSFIEERNYFYGRLCSENFYFDQSFSSMVLINKITITLKSPLNILPICHRRNFSIYQFWGGKWAILILAK